MLLDTQTSSEITGAGPGGSHGGHQAPASKNPCSLLSSKTDNNMGYPYFSFSNP